MDEIFKKDSLLQFWPTEKQTVKERVYSTTRFIVYLSVILYLIRRDVRILVMGVAALGVLYYMYQNGMVKDPEFVYKNRATPDNVMNNGLDGGPPDRLALREAWDTIHPYGEGRWFAEHNFYTAPTSDNEKFIKNAYSNMMMPVCRDDPYFCNPDNPMGRGTEWVQNRGGMNRRS